MKAFFPVFRKLLDRKHVADSHMFCGNSKLTLPATEIDFLSVGFNILVA